MSKEGRVFLSTAALSFNSWGKKPGSIFLFQYFSHVWNIHASDDEAV